MRSGADTIEKRNAFIASYKTAATKDNRLKVEVVAAYDMEKSTILLSDGWTGSTPADFSVLVHEMVHHLQNEARLSYECPAAREKLAFAAQKKWLSLFGRSLLTDFEIDSLTLRRADNSLRRIARVDRALGRCARSSTESSM